MSKNNQSIRALEKELNKWTKMENPGGGAAAKTIDDIGQDLLQSILRRLPALSFASAACVSRFWNSVCNRILLSCPKLASAMSFNPSLEGAVNEVVGKVLSQPIRPHFVLASVGPSFSLQQAHQLIIGKFGARIPLITNLSQGIIGRDAITDEFKEVQWEITEEDGDSASVNVYGNRGIMLTVGYLPGLKAHIVPLLSQGKGSKEPLMDEFVMKIKEYALNASGSTSPAGILLFADYQTDMNCVIQKMDYAFSNDTVIVGDRGSEFLYRSDCGDETTRRHKFTSAVALLLARDREKSPGIGETQFHVFLSTGVSPIGPTYKAARVKEHRGDNSTWLTARREAHRENLDGLTILTQIDDELGDRIQVPAWYIGVIKRRKCSVGTEKVRWITFQEFHEVSEGDDEYLYIHGVGIKTGDFFHFYLSDSNAALSSCNKISEILSSLKQDSEHRNGHQVSGMITNGKTGEVFGGIIFSCCGRGDSFFGRPNVDSSPFLENFPGIPLSGTYCSGEIGRGDMSLYSQEYGDENVRCCLHIYSTVYLVMSYTPPLEQH